MHSTSSISHTSEATLAFNLRWLLRVRWIVLFGQFLLICAVDWWVGLELPLLSLCGLLGLIGLSNLGLWCWGLRLHAYEDFLVGATILLDLTLFTIALILTGGPANPFSFFFLVYLVLGIMMLGSYWFLGISAFTLACYGSLFWFKGEHSHHMHHPKAMQMHLEGMLLAYALTTAFLVYFVTRFKGALRQREAEITKLQRTQIQSEKLATLATVASAAAHEFSTPLSTIALVSKELARGLEKFPELDPSLAEDARLIREQVERCRYVLEEMVHNSGELLGESSTHIRPDVLFAQVLERVDFSEVRTEIDEALQEGTLFLPRKAFVQVLLGLVNNAVDASGTEGLILLKAEQKPGLLLLRVEDRGKGVAPEHLSRLGEPFFTTKPQGHGNGLGVFLAKTLIERLGGEMTFKSVLGKGTEVSIQLPRSPFFQAHTREESLGGES